MIYAKGSFRVFIESFKAIFEPCKLSDEQAYSKSRDQAYKIDEGKRFVARQATDNNLESIGEHG